MQSEVARGDAASIASKICCPIIVSGSCSFLIILGGWLVIMRNIVFLGLISFFMDVSSEMVYPAGISVCAPLGGISDSAGYRPPRKRHTSTSS